MAYTPIDKGGNFMSPVIYTGNGNDNRQITGVGFQPSWSWFKERSGTEDHMLFDSIRGATKRILSNSTAAETDSGADRRLLSFDSDGFTVGVDNGINGSSKTYVGWNWIGANPPKKTYVVKVVSDGGNKYRFDDFGTNAVTLELSEGGTFIFDQSDSSNNGHPLRFSTTSNGTHAGGSIYTTGVVVSGTPGQAGAKTTITVAASAPTLYYFCTVHSGMGGQANTPVTNSFTNLDGSLQSNVSPNTISRFSIVSWTNSGSSVATVGHGLGVTPKMIIIKSRNETAGWLTYHEAIGNTKGLFLNTTGAQDDNVELFNDTSPTATVFTTGVTGLLTGGSNLIAYCFADVQGFSKMGSYLGNGNVDGTFVYTGFKPSFILVKRTNGSENWTIMDSARDPSNVAVNKLHPNTTGGTDAGATIDILSNGFKNKTTNAGANGNGDSYIYMAFAENPFTSSAGTPVTAR